MNKTKQKTYTCVYVTFPKKNNDDGIHNAEA